MPHSFYIFFSLVKIWWNYENKIMEITSPGPLVELVQEPKKKYIWLCIIFQNVQDSQQSKQLTSTPVGRSVIIQTSKILTWWFTGRANRLRSAKYSISCSNITGRANRLRSAESSISCSNLLFPLQTFWWNRQNNRSTRETFKPRKFYSQRIIFSWK